VRAGYSVRAGDLFADADLVRMAKATRVENYPAALAAVVGGPQSGGWMYTGALENHPRLVDRLARLRPLLGNPAAVLRRVRNPRRVAEALHDAGLCAPAVRLAARDVPRDGRWLAKPRRSAGGARIEMASGGLPQASRPSTTYYQQFVEGTPCSAVYVAAAGRAMLLGITRQLVGEAWTGASGFRYCGSIGPLELSDEAVAQFTRIGDVLARAFELVGLFGVDAIANSAGVWPVEVNPRCTASVEIVERTSDLLAIPAHVTACTEGRLPRQPPTKRGAVSGKAILFAAAPLVIPAAWAERALAAPDQEPPLIADIPAAPAALDAGAPIVTIFADAPDEATAMRELKVAAARVLATLHAAG
jgi:predicted ATP-grasp superfamily ATP-dependent carboligase